MNPPRQLRLWPGVLAVTLQWIIRFGLPAVVPESMLIGIAAEFLGALAVLVWWVFFSRAPRIERWGAVPLIILVSIAIRPILHPSVATGMMGMMFAMYAIPVICLALVLWAAATRNLSDGLRRATLAGAIALACGVFAFLRTDGITGGGHSQFAWRWSKTNEEELLARAKAEPSPAPVAAVKEAPVERTTPLSPPSPPPPSAHVEVAPKVKAVPPSVDSIKPATNAEWPGFRGPQRDSEVRGLRIKTDWAGSPPVQLWRREVGPGWSSFAVGDGLFYTQEQRGDFEVVACHKVSTGEPVWTHQDAARFWESNAGAGPRGTPTLSGGRVYTFGATGILNALDAATGSVLWTRNAASDTGAKLPDWGFASSPLVFNDTVIVAASGRLAAYDAVSGKPRWSGPDAGGSYSSPQLLTIGGVEQAVLLGHSGAISIDPRDGSVLWKHSWTGFPMLQPALVPDSGILITTATAGGGAGTRRLAIAHGPTGWNAEEMWTSTGLKPYFNDLVVHKGHAFGFDGGIFSCIDLKDGKRKWKGGRFGHGQMVLLPDQDLLFVLSEEGELALVAASPDQFNEVARFHAIEGKTWNHPALARDTVLVRNGQEMAAFRLTRADD